MKKNLGCEFNLLSSCWAYHHQQEWLNMYPDGKSLLCMRKLGLLRRMGEHAFSVWVALQYLSRSEPLMTSIQLVSYSPVFEQIWTTDEKGWTSIQQVSCSLVFKQIQTTDKNGWISIQEVSYSPVVEQIWTTDKNEWTSIQVVSCSQVFEQIWTTD